MISSRYCRPLRHLWLAAPLLLAASPAHAQKQDQQLWLQANTNVPVADNLRVTLEQIARFGNRQDGLFQTEFGALLGSRVAKGVELGFGYRKVGFHNGNTARNEDRVRQQVVVTSGRFVGRFRIDERFHPEDSEIAFRIRPLLRYNQPVGKKGWAVFVSHESFLIPNTTRWGQRSGYERMRNLVGVTVPVAERVSLDAGYINQYRLGRDGAQGQMDHGLSLQLTINIAPDDAPKLDD